MLDVVVEAILPKSVVPRLPLLASYRAIMARSRVSAASSTSLLRVIKQLVLVYAVDKRVSSHANEQKGVRQPLRRSCMVLMVPFTISALMWSGSLDKAVFNGRPVAY